MVDLISRVNLIGELVTVDLIKQVDLIRELGNTVTSNVLPPCPPHGGSCSEAEAAPPKLQPGAGGPNCLKRNAMIVIMMVMMIEMPTNSFKSRAACMHMAYVFTPPAKAIRNLGIRNSDTRLRPEISVLNSPRPTQATPKNTVL